MTETQCVFILKYYDYTCFESRVFYQDFLNRDIGRNHVNKTARHGIVAHRHWEENLGNITEVFVDNSSGIIAGFAAQNSFGRISPGKDLGYISQIVLP